MQVLSNERLHSVAKRIRLDESVALQSHHDVVPIQTIAEANSAIDRLFGDAPQRAQSGALIAAILRRDSRFRELEDHICANARETAARNGQMHLPAEPFHVLRCASVATRAESHCRHYDSHLLTLLIPLRLAADGEWNGDLVMYPRPRLSVSTLGNMVCKARHGLQRSLPFQWRKRLTRWDLRRGNCSRVPVRVGSVYEFNGFALQHANLDVQQGQRRTLLIHYYDPGCSMGLSEVLRRGRIPR